VDDICSAGCNDLIKRNKAQLIDCTDDLIVAMQWQEESKEAIQTCFVEMMYDLTDNQQRLLQLLRETEDGLHINQLVMETQLAYSIVSSELVMMELQDVVKSMPGVMWRVKK
jgi:DNA processing protein